MSSERYELAQDDLEALLERVESTIDLIADKKKKGNSEERRYWISRSRSELNDARGFIQEMEREARAAPSQYRNEMLSKVRQFREEMARLQTRLRQATDLTSSLNVGLGGNDNIDGRGLEGLSEEEKLRQQVMLGKESLEKSSQSIVRSQQVAVETEEIGDAIITDLGLQREALERSRARLHETDAELSRGRSILLRLKVATLYNKIILLFIIIIELCIITALVYWKWFKK